MTLEHIQKSDDAARFLENDITDALRSAERDKNHLLAMLLRPMLKDVADIAARLTGIRLVLEGKMP